MTQASTTDILDAKTQNRVREQELGDRHKAGMALLLILEELHHIQNLHNLHSKRADLGSGHVLF